MPPRGHALLGASGASRWLNCPPSAKWELTFREGPHTEAAEEGTLAHAIAEAHLSRALAGKKIATSARHKKHPLYRPSMEDYVGVYVDYVLEQLAEAKAHTSDATLLLEESVDFSRYVPDGFGTADAILIADEEMHVFDFKYGKGIPVEAENNPQTRLYGLGSYEAYGMLYGIRRIRMHIVQPRLENITSEALSVGELMQWGEEYVKPLAELAAAGNGVFRAGEHCRWCRCKNVCRYHSSYQLEIARLRFAQPENEERFPAELSPSEIAEILQSVDGLTRWAKSIKDYALDQAVNHGAAFPGWKVVEGRSNRIVTDESAAIDRLDREGFTTDRITKLRGLGELEEIVGKKNLAAILDGILIKPAGKPVLAKESDRRPVFHAAETVFSPMEDEDG